MENYFDSLHINWYLYFLVGCIFCVFSCCSGMDNFDCVGRDCQYTGVSKPILLSKLQTRNQLRKRLSLLWNRDRMVRRNNGESRTRQRTYKDRCVFEKLGNGIDKISLQYKLIGFGAVLLAVCVWGTIAKWNFSRASLICFATDVFIDSLWDYPKQQIKATL